MKPEIGPDCFIAPGAWVMGDVRLGTPGKVVRILKEGENPAVEIAGEYIQVAREHRKGKYDFARPGFDEANLKLKYKKGKNKS